MLIHAKIKINNVKKSQHIQLDTRQRKEYIGHLMTESKHFSVILKISRSGGIGRRARFRV